MKTGSQPEVGLPRVTKEAEGKRETCRTLAVLENLRWQGVLPHHFSAVGPFLVMSGHLCCIAVQRCPNESVNTLCKSQQKCGCLARRNLALKTLHYEKTRYVKKSHREKLPVQGYMKASNYTHWQDGLYVPGPATLLLLVKSERSFLSQRMACLPL